MYLPYKKKRLSVKFDAKRMADELSAIPQEAWSFHGFHNTGHRVLPLLSTNGSLRNDDGTYNHSLIPPFLPTEHLRRLPYINSVIHSFGARPFRTRIAELPPGRIITPHRDLHPNWYNKVRLHIPIVTDPGVLCHIWSDRGQLTSADLESWHMAAGEAWVFNIWYVHAVTNLSPHARIHLVIDFQPEGRLFELMFGDVSKDEIIACMSYNYPSSYQTDLETLTWLSGGKPEVGKALWNVEVLEKNPQLHSYSYPEKFWAPESYDIQQPAA